MAEGAGALGPSWLCVPV